MKMTKKQLITCIICFIGLNVIAIIGIMILVGNNENMAPKSDNELLVNSPVSVDEEVVENLEHEESEVMDIEVEEDLSLFKETETKLSEEENYRVIYKALIPGIYEAEEGIIFNFQTDGTFTGYYNKDNPSVEKYNYDIVVAISDGEDSFIN